MVLDPIRIQGLSYLLLSCLVRPKADGTTTPSPVFGKGILDLIDDVFWHLPFSSVRQAKRVRQDFNITEEVWNTRCSLIRADHRLPNAREELERLWKELIEKDLAAIPGAAEAGVVDPADVLPLEDE